jgi:hypothetical protein
MHYNELHNTKHGLKNKTLQLVIWSSYTENYGNERAKRAAAHGSVPEPSSGKKATTSGWLVADDAYLQHQNTYEQLIMRRCQRCCASRRR